jgi:hypothetical protein
MTRIFAMQRHTHTMLASTLLVQCTIALKRGELERKRPVRSSKQWAGWLP